MTIKFHACISISCDACRGNFTGDLEDGIAHFDNVHDARDTAEAAEADDDWFISESGLALCGDDSNAHLALAVEWAAGQLVPEELERLRAIYPQLAPDDDRQDAAGNAPTQEEATP